jgi:hypothetical protein
MRSFITRALGFLVLINAISGCAKGSGLNVERAVTVESHGNWFMAVPPQTRDQQVKISVDSPDTPVTLYLVTDKDVDALMDQLANGAEIKVPVLEKREKVQSVNLSRRMTVGNELAVLISNATGKPARITVRLTGE